MQHPDINSTKALKAIVHQSKHGKSRSLAAALKKYAPCDVIDCYYPSGKTAIHYAAEKGHAECVLRLQMSGAEINCQTIEPSSPGLTPLHLAISHSREEVLACLLYCGAKTDIPDSKGVLPVMLAVRNGKLDCLKLLISKGANVNIQLPHGGTLLHETRQIDVNQKNECGDTALHLAVRIQNLSVVATLIAHGADMELRNNEGVTPPQLARRLQCANVVGLFESLSRIAVHDTVLEHAKEKLTSSSNSPSASPSTSRSVTTPLPCPEAPPTPRIPPPSSSNLNTNAASPIFKLPSHSPSPPVEMKRRYSDPSKLQTPLKRYTFLDKLRALTGQTLSTNVNEMSTSHSCSTFTPPASASTSCESPQDETLSCQSTNVSSEENTLILGAQRTDKRPISTHEKHPPTPLPPTPPVLPPRPAPPSTKKKIRPLPTIPNSPSSVKMSTPPKIPPRTLPMSNTGSPTLVLEHNSTERSPLLGKPRASSCDTGTTPEGKHTPEVFEDMEKLILSLMQDSNTPYDDSEDSTTDSDNPTSASESESNQPGGHSIDASLQQLLDDFYSHCTTTTHSKS
ncbi:hypothetical protein Pelo_8652 [Pelomyxa schiedti]|nr:hypothetical protein Pelo_8652 [Pelomyxa schiedti]